MAEKQVRKSPQTREENDNSTSSGKQQKETRAREVSAITDDVIADIDLALKKALDFDEGEDVSEEEFDKRAEEFTNRFQQKSGQ